MDGGNRLVFRVKEQNRRTVGGKAHKRDAGLVGDQPVADNLLLPEKTGATVPFANAQDGIGVQLSGKDRFLRQKANSLAQNPVVFPDVFRQVPAMGAEIERGQISFAHAAIARGKAVDAA